MKDHRYSVRGFGRVGSYAAAKQALRCRARRYWAIVRWDDTPVGDSPLAPKTGWVECPEYGRWPTKKAAEAHLASLTLGAM